MSDTPQTDEWSVDITCGVFGQTLLWKNSKGPFVSRRLAEKLERENAALREAFAKAEVLWKHAGCDGNKEFADVSGYFWPGEIIVVMDRAAFDAARKEDKL